MIDLAKPTETTSTTNTLGAITSDLHIEARSEMNCTSGFLGGRFLSSRIWARVG